MKYIFFNITNVFMVTFDQFNVSLLEENINKKNVFKRSKS